MENRLIYKVPGNSPDNSPQNPEPLQSATDLEAKRSMVQLQTQTDVSGILSEEEISAKKKESDILYAKTEISKFENTFNSSDLDKNLSDFEKASTQAETQIKPMTLPLLMEKTKTDYKNWNVFSNDGLAQVFVELKALNVDTESPFYKSLFSILYNANSLVDSGYFDADSKSGLFANPIGNEYEISQMNFPDKGFNGKLYIEAFKHLLKLQQKLLSVDLDNAVSEEQSWGDKQGDKLNGFIGDVVSDVQTAFKEKNVPKLLLYGLGGFLAFKAGGEIWGTKFGKGGVYAAGLASLIYLTGNGKGFEKLLGSITGSISDTYGAAKDNFTGGNGPMDFAEWVLEKAGVDDNVKNVLATMGITTENVAEVLGKGPNSIDNLGMVVNMSSNPSSLEIKEKGIDNETLIKLKEAKMKDLLELAKESDKKDPTAKFIPPNSESIKTIFPEFKLVALPTFRTHKELEEIKEKSSILKTGGLNSSHYNYVELGQMLYNIVAAMRLGYDERIRPNDPDYGKVTFDAAINSGELEGMTVRHYLNALNEYTQLESAKYIARLKEISESISEKNPGFTEQMELKVIDIDVKTGVYDVLVYGMPMRTVYNPKTGGFDLYLFSKLSKGKVPDSSDVPFLRIPEQLKNGIFEEKFGEIVERDLPRLETAIPQKTVKINDKEYKRDDMTFGPFKRSAGKWTMNVVSKEELAKGNQVILMVAEVFFDGMGAPQVKFLDRSEAKGEMEQFALTNTPDKQEANGKFDHLRDIITNKNLVDAEFVDNLEFVPISYLENFNIFDFKINGLFLKATYDSDKNEYQIYNPYEPGVTEASKTVLIVPSELKNEVFIEKFIKPRLSGVLDLSGEVEVDGTKYKPTDKKVGDIYWDANKKVYIAPIFSNLEPKISLQEAIISFDTDNNPQIKFVSSKEVISKEKEKEDAKAETASNLKEINDLISTMKRPFENDTGNIEGYKSPDNIEIINENEIIIKTYGKSFAIIKEAENQWNFKEEKMKAKGGYNLAQTIIMADLANKVLVFREKFPKEIEIFHLDDEFVLGLKHAWGKTKGETVLTYNEVTAMKAYFNASDFIGWTQNVIDKASKFSNSSTKTSDKTTSSSQKRRAGPLMTGR